ncbi:MAG TPA: M50 family metallopeptidase [Sedimentisphaerales bacterium]|jgi:Zn-dependent protease|nr:M50 family metallopeptidase [Sedimentisphaerales bacterium]HNU27552.1 M50 family metallopeptidase [Sedimentisphaerales bacterium]
MTPTRQGSIHLFRLAGIDLYLHWTWFLVAWYGIDQRVGRYSSPVWNAVEYLALFAIVLMHEFGHSLACRQVGGQADQIVLWPLGGVAYVQPPQRPGAILWSLAAGPLVNVVLVPVLWVLKALAMQTGVFHAMPNAYHLLQAITYINFGLLIFNLLPIYPLDGGQILRSLLWFVVGRAWSLTVTAILGLVGVAGLVALAVWSGSPWLGVLCVFIVLNCWSGLRYGLRLLRLARAPRREGFACPSCRAAPPMGSFWSCPNCRTAFDVFEAQPACPQCGTVAAAIWCMECGEEGPIYAWRPPSAVRTDVLQSPVGDASA